MRQQPEVLAVKVLHFARFEEVNLKERGSSSRENGYKGGHYNYQYLGVSDNLKSEISAVGSWCVCVYSMVSISCTASLHG